MLATLVHEPVDRRGWVYEEKYDGVRAMAYRRRGGVKLLSRSFEDMTAQFPEVAAAVEHASSGGLVLDGEIVVFDRDDVSRFQLLQQRAGRAVYAAFDCLEMDGETLLHQPLRERRRALEAVVPSRGRAAVLMRARRIDGSGVEAYRTAEGKGWEGIVAKDEESPYEPGRRSRCWLKVKCRKQSEFVVGGYTAPRGARSDFGAILVGLYDGDRLRFVGKVGAGFSRATLAGLASRMASLRAAAPPFAPAPRAAGVTWVRPRLVAEIAFAEWTDDGKLRQPVFLGLRDDKDPRECTWAERET